MSNKRTIPEGGYTHFDCFSHQGFTVHLHSDGEFISLRIPRNVRISNKVWRKAIDILANECVLLQSQDIEEDFPIIGLPGTLRRDHCPQTNID